MKTIVKLAAGIVLAFGVGVLIGLTLAALPEPKVEPHEVQGHHQHV
jgi:hypothetical protein